MLVLSRKAGDQLIIGDDVVLTVNKISGNRVAIGIEAPREVSIVRGELSPGESAKNELAGKARRGGTPASGSMESLTGVSVASQANL